MSILEQSSGLSYHEISRLKKLLINKHETAATSQPGAVDLAAAGEAAFQQLLEGQERKEQLFEGVEEGLEGEEKKELIGRGWKICPTLPKGWRIKTHYWGNR